VLCRKTSPPKALVALGGLAHDVIDIVLYQRRIALKSRSVYPDLLQAKSGAGIGRKVLCGKQVPFTPKTSSKGTGRAHTDYQSELTTRITWQPASGKALFRSGPPVWLAPL
jgi:hypothetical protein